LKYFFPVITIGTTQNCSGRNPCQPDVLAEFTEKFPGVEIAVQEDTIDRLFKLAHGYGIGLTLASQPIQDERLEVRELFVEERSLALPPRYRLTRKRTVSVPDLEGERLIVIKEGHCPSDQVLGFCARSDLKPRISFRSSQLETTQALVCFGLGVSLIPVVAARNEREDLPEYRSLQTPKPERKIVARWPGQRLPGRAANEFLKLAATQSKKHSG